MEWNLSGRSATQPKASCVPELRAMRNDVWESQRHFEETWLISLSKPWKLRAGWRWAGIAVP